MMNALILALLMAVPTPPGFLLLAYLISFFVIHATLKEIFNAR